MANSSGISASSKATPSAPATSSKTSTAKAQKSEASPAPAKEPAKNAPSPTPPGKENQVASDKGAKPAPPSDKTGPAPPSGGLSTTEKGSAAGGLTQSLNDSLSLSKEGSTFSSGSRSGSEGTTQLVDKLVDAFGGESSSFDRGTRSWSGSSHHQGTHLNVDGECHSRSYQFTEKKIKRLDEASSQIAEAQSRVDSLMEKVVDSQIYDKPGLPDQIVKRAEREQERLTKAEGRLHRTKQSLTAKEEFRRQDLEQQRTLFQNAERRLQEKYEKAGPALKDHILQKFRPLLARDGETRRDHTKLDSQAEWHLKTDAEASRLAREAGFDEQGQPLASGGQHSPIGGAADRPAGAEGQKVEELKHRVEGGQFEREMERTETGRRDDLLRRELSTLESASQDTRRELTEQLKRQTRETPTAGQRKLRERLDSHKLEEDIAGVDEQERPKLINRCLQELGDVPASVRREFEGELNRRLVGVEEQKAQQASPTAQARTEEQRRRTVENLLKTKESQKGNVGTRLDVVDDSIDRLDRDSVEQAANTLNSAQGHSIESSLDVNRLFGRDVHQVRADLVNQVSRGGSAQSKGRDTLSKLDHLLRRVTAFESGDSWTALRQTLRPSGPHLNRFLGLPDGPGPNAIDGGAATINAPDPGAARRLARRLYDSGARVDEEWKVRLLTQAGA